MHRVLGGVCNARFCRCMSISSDKSRQLTAWSSCDLASALDMLSLYDFSEAALRVMTGLSVHITTHHGRLRQPVL